MDFVQFLGLRWPDESTRLFTMSIAEVLAFRDWMPAESKAPKTINRRIASLSSSVSSSLVPRDPCATAFKASTPVSGMMLLNSVTRIRCAATRRWRGLCINRCRPVCTRQRAIALFSLFPQAG